MTDENRTATEGSLAAERAQSEERRGRSRITIGEHRFASGRCERCGMLEMLARPFGWPCAPGLDGG